MDFTIITCSKGDSKNIVNPIATRAQEGQWRERCGLAWAIHGLEARVLLYFVCRADLSLEDLLTWPTWGKDLEALRVPGTVGVCSRSGFDRNSTTYIYIYTCICTISEYIFIFRFYSYLYICTCIVIKFDISIALSGARPPLQRHMLRRAREKGYCTAIASCYPNLGHTPQGTSSLLDANPMCH